MIPISQYNASRGAVASRSTAFASDGTVNKLQAMIEGMCAENGALTAAVFVGVAVSRSFFYTRGLQARSVNCYAKIRL